MKSHTSFKEIVRASTKSHAQVSKDAPKKEPIDISPKGRASASSKHAWAHVRDPQEHILRSTWASCLHQVTHVDVHPRHECACIQNWHFMLDAWHHCQKQLYQNTCLSELQSACAKTCWLAHAPCSSLARTSTKARAKHTSGSCLKTKNVRLARLV